MIPKGEYGRAVGCVGFFASKNHPAVSEMKPVKEAQREMTNGFSRGGWRKRIDDGHVRRMREISGREIR